MIRLKTELKLLSKNLMEFVRFDLQTLQVGGTVL